MGASARIRKIIQIYKMILRDYRCPKSWGYERIQRV
jgi:hypothetical protein